MTAPRVEQILVKTDPPDTTESVREQTRPSATDKSVSQGTTTEAVTKTIAEDGTILPDTTAAPPTTKGSFSNSLAQTKSVSVPVAEMPNKTTKTISDIRTKTTALSEDATKSDIFPTSKYVPITTSVASVSTIPTPTPPIESFSVERTSKSTVIPVFSHSQSLAPEIVATNSLLPSKTGGTVANKVPTSTFNQDILKSVTQSSDILNTASTYSGNIAQTTSEIPNITSSTVQATPVIQTTPDVKSETLGTTDLKSSAVYATPVQSSKTFVITEISQVVTSNVRGADTSTIDFGTTTSPGSLLSTNDRRTDIKTTPSFMTSSSGHASDFNILRTPVLTSTYATSSVAPRSETPPLESSQSVTIGTSSQTLVSSIGDITSNKPILSSNLSKQTPSEHLITSILSSFSNIDSISFTKSSYLPSETKPLSLTKVLPVISPTLVTSQSQTIDYSVSQSPAITSSFIIPMSSSNGEKRSTPIIPIAITTSELTNTATDTLVPSTSIVTNYVSPTTTKLEPSLSSVLKSVITATPSFRTEAVGASPKFSAKMESTAEISPTRTVTVSTEFVKSSVSSVMPTVSQLLPPIGDTSTTNEPSTESVTVSPPGGTNRTIIQSTAAPSDTTITMTSTTVAPPSGTSETTSEQTTKNSTTLSPPRVTTQITSSPTKGTTTVVPPSTTTQTTSEPTKGSTQTTSEPTTVSTTVVPPSTTTQTTSEPTKVSTIVVPPSTITQTTSEPKTTSSPQTPVPSSDKPNELVTTQNTVTVIVNTTDISAPRNETLKAEMSTTTIVGIAVGSIMGFWIILGPLVCFLCRMKDRAKDRRNRPYDVDDPDESDFFLRDYVATHLARSRPTNFQNQHNNRYSMDVFTHIENGVMKTEL
jgi:hypothetical protein